MNQQLKELSEQAGFQFDEYNEPTQRKVETLVELMLAECCGVIDTDYSLRTGVDYATRIKKHFGV